MKSIVRLLRTGSSLSVVVLLATIYPPQLMAADLVAVAARAQTLEQQPGFTCGFPARNNWQDNELVLWRDCQQGRMHLFASGGVNGALRSGGVASSTGFLRISNQSVETDGADLLDNKDPRQLVFRLNVKPGSSDQFSFEATTPEQVCISTDSSNTQTVLVGPDLKPVLSPFNAVTLQPCGVEHDRNEQASCGYPPVHLRDNSKLLVWRDCGSRLWHVRSRSLNNRFEGEIVSNSTVTSLVNVSVESHSTDSLELVDPHRIKFKLATDGIHSDEFLFSTQNNDGFCLRLEDNQSQSVMVGRQGRLQASPLDPAGLGLLSCASPAPLTVQTQESTAQQASCTAGDLPQYRIADAALVVAHWGSDSNPGTQSQPLRTLGRAAKLARGGKLVLVRGGVYRQQQVIDHGGDASNPLIFAAWPGERPIIDGAGVWIARNRGLIQVQASDVVIDGFEIKNSVGRGVSVYSSDRVTLRRSYIHDIKYKGYGGSGNDLVVEQNRFRNLVTSAQWGNFGVPWDGGISTWHRPPSYLSHGFKLLNNDISRVWGECVIPIFTHGAVISGNRIVDCYSVSIYADNARSLLIDRNMIGRSSNEFNRRDNNRAAVGVGLAVEKYDIGSFRVDQVTISNNLILRTDRGVSFYDDPNHSPANNTYQRVVIAHNIICGNDYEAIQFPFVRGAWPFGNAIKNNVLCRGQAGRAGTVSLSQTGPWSISHNAYPDGIPSLDYGSWISGDPGFTSGSGFSREAYRLRSDSRLRYAGTPLATVSHDVNCGQRSSSAPSIGLFD